jgi:hypothetical protein
MQAIRLGEDQALKDYLDSLGPRGAIKVTVNRKHPKSLRVNGKDYNTEGYQATFDEAVDEEYLRENLGGGTYDLTIKSRSGTGSFLYAGHRTVTVAGDPKIEKLPTNAQAAPPGAPAPDTSTKMVVDLLKEELAHARTADKPEGIPPAMQMLLDQMRDDARRRDRELDALRAQLAETRDRKPAEDTVKDKIMDRLLDGESTRITAITAKHDAEIRMIRESHQQEVRLLEDRHDRAMGQMRQTHELTVATLKQGYEREIAAMNAAAAMTGAATQQTANLTATTLNSEIKRMERELADLRAENKELRERKDKSLIEQIGDLKRVKEALGIEDGDGEGGTTAEKVIAALPAAIQSVGDVIARSRPSAAVPAQVQVQAVAPKARVVQRPDGQRFIQRPDATLVPVRVKPKIVTTEAGQQIEAPTVDPAQLALLISYLEQAFRRDEAPEIVAQSGRAQIPPEILTWIRDNHTEQVAGVDLFMQKVAKLPSTSPLATQGGRVWIRKVGVALIEG